MLYLIKINAYIIKCEMFGCLIIITGFENAQISNLKYCTKHVKVNIKEFI